jgi:hypothetical protein
MEFLPEALKPLCSLRQFIICSFVPRKSEPGKFDKFPIDYKTGKVANAHDPNIWLDSTTALSILKQQKTGFGLGFVFTRNDPYFFIDLDNCLSPCGTKWNDVAITICQAFAGAAVEISSSGKGLHIIGKGNAPPHGCRNKDHKVELYTEGRFIALTGTGAVGSADTDCSRVLPWLVNNFFKKEKVQSQDVWTSSPVEQWNGPTDDETLIARMLSSRSGNQFNPKATFKDLWECNRQVLSKFYPPIKSQCDYNESDADAALAQHLAFWTGNNCERMLNLMRQSKLVREKWNRKDYLPRTIRVACGRQKEWLIDKKQTEVNTNVPKSQPQIIGSTAFLTFDQQLKLFEGCVYICDQHKVLVPGGYLLNPDRFRVMFGGYMFPMDAENAKVCRNAWEAFTESRGVRHPRVDSSTFRPDLPAGEIIVRAGETLVNVYHPIKTTRKQGDATLFIRHMKNLFGEDRDIAIITSYMAAVPRYLGVKFQWCPLIQGVEGNGKTLLTRIVAHAVGDRYTHYPKAQELGSKFNDWMFGRVFIGVEDIYDGRREIVESLKPMITANKMEIEPKGGMKITQDICCNFIINTNHKDGLRKHRGDRRFAPFYTKQQDVSDLKTYRMDGDYFYKLYTWLYRQDGLAIVADYLDNYEIPDEFNPATRCHRAPNTTSTDTAIEESRTNIEQEINESIEQGAIGFRGGWVSSLMLNNLFARLRLDRISHNKRRDIMKGLGYDYHPYLVGGRVNNVVMPDGSKPRLFIQLVHPHREISNPTDIARLYTEAQSS